MKILFNILMILMITAAVLREKYSKRKDLKGINIILIVVLVVTTMGLFIINNFY